MDFAQLVAELEEHRRGDESNLIAVRSVDSTNELARRLTLEFLREQLTLTRAWIVAYEQLAGRGRQGRSWSSPAGGGLYATLVLPGLESAELTALPLLVGVGLCSGLRRHLGERCGLKWPNDVLVGGRKLAGVLIESLSAHHETVALVGVGVNYAQDRAGLPTPTATSIRLECGDLPGLGVLAREVFAAIAAELTHLGESEHAVNQYARLSVHRQGDRMRCRLGDEVVEGSFAGFDRRGFLRLHSGGHDRLISSGEVIQ